MLGKGKSLTETDMRTQKLS